MEYEITIRRVVQYTVRTKLPHGINPDALTRDELDELISKPESPGMDSSTLRVDDWRAIS